jgi:hypothetical protein
MADTGSNADMQRAYFAMMEYLEAYWKRSNSAEVAGMLGDMNLLRDGSSMDPAVWEDWKAAWERSKSRMNDSVR